MYIYHIDFKPQYCKSGFYNFDIDTTFKDNRVFISERDYYFAKYTYANISLQPLQTNIIRPYKIPLISHDIWLTDPKYPQEISTQNIDLLKNKIDIMDQENSHWSHILWTNCRSCLNNTAKQLENTNIKILDINEVEDQLIINTSLLQLVNKGLFGISSDYLRYRLLEIYGGFYSDINFILFKSPADLFHDYDFLVQTQPGVGFIITPSMISTKKSHPIISATMDNFLMSLDRLELIQESYPDCDIYNLTLITSYIPFLISFYLFANKGGTIDIAFDPSIHEVTHYIQKNNFSSYIVDKILMDFNNEFPECDNNSEYKNYERFTSTYEKQGICLTTEFNLIGIDIGEDSWNKN